MAHRLRARPTLLLCALVTAAGCATGRDLGPRLDELKAEQARLAAEQARQGKELAELRARVDGLPRAPARPARAEPSEVKAVPLGDSPVDGPDDAWVTVVEFTDFQCPFCARAQPTLRTLRDQYGASVRFVLKHNPLAFHPRAMPAAIAAECAREQDRFWPFARMVFERQADLQSGEPFAAWAGELGLDVQRFERCVAGKEPEPRIERDRALATRVGAHGTPTFFINGRVLVGAVPLEKFTALVDEELAKAKASGVPAREYYRRAVEDAGVK